MFKINTILFCIFAAAGLVGQTPAVDARRLQNAESAAGRPENAQSPLIWRLRDRVLKSGETQNMDFLAFNFTDVAAYQFALKFDPSRLLLERIEILTIDLPLDSSGNFGLFNLAYGEIRTLWSSAQGYNLPPATPVFRLVFTTLSGGGYLSEALKIDPALLNPIAYNTQLIPKGVQLYYADYTKPADPRAENEDANPLPVSTNYPNPFTDCTTIGFTLPVAGAVRIRIFDNTGRQWLMLEKEGLTGFQEEPVCLEGAGAGMYFYEMLTPCGTLLRRIIKQ